MLLEGRTEATAPGDSGSDLSAPSAEIWDRLRKDVPTMEYWTLGEPMKLETEIGGSAANITFTISRDENIALNIILPGSHLPVQIREVNLLIIDQEKDEILLGLPMLKYIMFEMVLKSEKLLQ